MNRYTLLIYLHILVLVSFYSLMYVFSQEAEKLSNVHVIYVSTDEYDKKFINVFFHFTQI